MTPAQSRAVPSSFAEVIRASAGTGKTFQLSNRFIRLLVAGESPERILATTFTRKAAGEIEERVLLRLAKACSSEEAARVLSGDIKAEVSVGRCRALLARLAREQHRFAICTLDSLCMKIALGFALELGLPIEWRVMDESEEEELRAASIEKILAEEEPEIIVTLVRFLKGGDYGRSVQGALVRHIAGWHAHFLESDRNAWLWLDPPQRMSDEELRTAIERLAAAELPAVKGGAPDKNFQKARQRIIDSAMAGDWEDVFGSKLAVSVFKGEGVYYKKEIPAGLAEACRTICMEARAWILHRVRAHAESAYNLLRLFDMAHGQAKRNGGLLGFADVKRLLAKSDWTGLLEHLYYRLDGRIAHLLLDEFQDTSGAEWGVVRPIGQEIRAQPDQDRSLFCVGDVKQAIYGWRGGVAEIFDTLEQTWDLQPTSLKVSYRSGPRIIETVNRVFGGLARNAALADHGEAVRRWVRGFEEHSTELRELDGHVRLSVARAPGQDESADDALVREAAALVKRLAAERPDSEIGVLVRTNKMVARIIYELTRDGSGPRVSEEGGSPLTDSAAVCAVLSLLTMAEHPGDRVARFHVARSPLGAALGFTDYGDEEASDAFAARVRGEIAERGLGRFVWSTIRSIAGHVSERDHSRLLQLSDLAHAHRMGDRLSAFVRLVTRKKMEDPGAGRVRVMTIHQAKGLEFDVVVLPDLDQKLLKNGVGPVLTDRPGPIAPPVKILRSPNELVRMMHPDFERMHCAAVEAIVVEALCVLYVALTRAKDSLYMLVKPADKPELSHAGILRAALAEPSGEDGGVLFEIGAPPVYDEPPVEESVPSPLAFEPPASLAGEAPRRRAFLKRTASPRPAGFVGSGMFESAKRGTVMHKLFEHVAWLDEEPPDPETLAGLPELRRLAPAERQAALAAFRAALSKEAVRTTLGREAHAGWKAESLELFRERPFAVSRDGEVLTGVIDRLVVGISAGRPVRAEIIDFKSGSAAPEKERLYGEQLMVYRTAVARMLALDESAISCKLLFMGTGETRMVADG